MTIKQPPTGAAVLVASLAWLLTSCAGLRATERPPDDQFGHRFEGRASDGRETIVISTPEVHVEYAYFPAPHDTIHVRYGTADPSSDDGVPVEVLIKGAFPDACSELHSVEQERAGHLLNVRLLMRRQRGLLCASVVRPYRFYLLLDGRYESGHYSLKINDVSHPFVVPPRDG